MLEHVPSLFSVSLLLKLTIVAWTALLVRTVLRRQPGPHLILAGLCAVLSGTAAVTGVNPVPHGCSAVIAVALALVCFLRGSNRTSSTLLAVAAGVGLVLSAGAFYRGVTTEQPAVAWLLLAGNGLVSAVALIYALEMTWYLAPLEMRSEPSARLMMKRLSLACLTALVVSTFSLTTVFLGKGPESSLDGGRMRDEFQIIAWLFAVTVMVVQFVVWLGLRRALKCAAGDSEKKSGAKTPTNAAKVAQEWGSLTISAWIALAALIVSLAVPMSWPWQVNAPADALIGELLE